MVAFALLATSLSCQGESDCPTTTAERTCHGNDEQCERAREEPDEEHSFFLSLSPYRDDGDTVLDQDAIDHNWACLLRVLEEQGLSAEDPGKDKDRITVVATYSQLRPAIALEGVTGFQVSCGPDDCEYCWDLSLGDCAEDPFCYAVTAERIDNDSVCALPSEPVGCLPSDIECSEAITFAAPDDGDCQQFRNGCVPRGWSACTPSVESEFPGYFEPCE